MLVSHSHRFIFIKTRKTAGTSVEMALSRHMGPEDIVGPMAWNEDERVALGGRGEQNREIPMPRWRPRDWIRAVSGARPRVSQHSSARFVRQFFPDLWDDYFTFTVERNSWDLTVSAHSWYMHRHRPISFIDFVLSNAIEQYSNWPLYTIDDEIVVDKVIRYESLDDGLEEVGGLLEIPPLDLPRAKGSYRRRRPYQEWYDDRTRERVAEVFHREIECFEWRFE